MHYLVHYPAHIYRFGPMIRSWCMRYEAKHSYFKRLASYLGNFTNVALSLAERHQTRSCYLRNQPIAKKPKIDSAKEIVAKDSEHYYLLKEKEPNLSDISILSRSNPDPVGFAPIMRLICVLVSISKSRPSSAFLVSRIVTPVPSLTAFARLFF
ncbi:uncharacterized protein LOC124442066 isoform X2 [Xenia sp. Carnegie-2017]|uniref:uncharacterized protein LOC124442066 isoform X2 n=1 Tax=Xenia sp. Carnegie-2017 TaxID=2897299 RepID=UPI001F04F544|nr:uncharacterized protein LOC124442066 isoform X2 [Xenia sp. Carnegie-2017]